MHSSTREYEACVLVNGKPVTEVTHNGRTYIEGRKNSVYELQFKNKTNQRVLIIPSVDGLNVLDGEPCGKDSNGYVVGAYGSITIPGWKVDGKTAAKFVFKPQDAHRGKDQTYVESMDEDPENQGVIGFMVFREKRNYFSVFDFYGRNDRWDDGYRGGCFGDVYGSSNIRSCVQPTSFSASASVNTMSPSITRTIDTQSIGGHIEKGVDPDEGKSLGTGFGKATDFNTVTTTFERASENPEVVFSFLYDTLQNLKKAGVPVKQFQRRSKKPKAPNPFPNSPEIMSLGCRTPRGWRR